MIKIDNLTKRYRVAGRDAAGEALLRRAIDIAPDDGGAQHALGLLLVREQESERGDSVPGGGGDRGQLDAALDYARKLVQRVPHDPVAGQLEQQLEAARR